ncbi:hypothetical protein QYM36_017133 [Artemia franciscana]|uniref:Uncharacterized protein n=1 Tax=Artemia franciscana TaxID=6661 RepID=A0AA88HGS2_ARTSF|nr:hypothetical protein QYM36_017133 [Artemia franciscana]
MNTLGLKTVGLVTELCKKIKSGIVGQNVYENRGKRTSQHKISVEIREQVTSYINSFKPCTPLLPEKKCSEYEALAFFADNPVYV